MSGSGAMPVRLRLAGTADLAAVEALQHAAFAANRTILGVEPLPLQADYTAILQDYDVWLAERDAGCGLAGVLIVARPADGSLLIWSIATAPVAQGSGVGNTLMTHAADIAHRQGLTRLKLYTGEKLVQNVAWYQRHGFVVTHREALADRVIVHMEKDLAKADAAA